MLLEVVLPETVDDPASENRWSLLASAARLYAAELHFVVPALDPAGKRRAAATSPPPGHGPSPEPDLVRSERLPIRCRVVALHYAGPSFPLNSEG